MNILEDFLTEEQMNRLLQIAEGSSEWTPGRQGTGYEILSLKEVAKYDLLVQSLLDYCLASLGKLKGGDEFWDVYLIRYPDGSYIPSHKDEAALFGKRHRRLNALVKKPEAGGDLVIDGLSIDLDPGDAVVFFPDEREHEVTKCTGTRILWSVGCWL